MSTVIRPGETESSFAPLPGRREAMEVLDARVGNMLRLSRTEISGIVNAWQPSDHLPDFRSPDLAFQHIREVQEQARQLPEDVLLVLAGNTLTEKGLPTFTADIASTYGSQGGGPGSVASALPHLRKWFGRWAGEEQKHEVALGNWLQYTGRIDMGAFDRSTQLYLEDGTDLGIESDPYKGIIYTSFQELATHRSHKNIMKLLKAYGNRIIAVTCGEVAADEARHAATYREFACVLFEHDPNGMMCALRDMLKHGITMPAHNMREIDRAGNAAPPGEMFQAFSSVAEKLRVYTAKDYAEISAYLLKEWKVARNDDGRWEALPMGGLEEEGRDAQTQIIRRQATTERIAARPRTSPQQDHDWSWLTR